MNRAANRYGVGQQITAIEVCQNFRNLMPELFTHKEAGQYISPAHYKNHVLTLNVANTAWAQEVLMRKPKIIEEMNKKAGKQIIRSLKTQLKSTSPY